MLVLRRKVGERIVLPDTGLTLSVIAVEGNAVRLGISAPAEVVVHREEVWRRICAQLQSVPGTTRQAPADTVALGE